MEHLNLQFEVDICYEAFSIKAEFLHNGAIDGTFRIHNKADQFNKSCAYPLSDGLFLPTTRGMQFCFNVEWELKSVLDCSTHFAGYFLKNGECWINWLLIYKGNGQVCYSKKGSFSKNSGFHESKEFPFLITRKDLLAVSTYAPFIKLLN